MVFNQRPRDFPNEAFAEREAANVESIWNIGHKAMCQFFRAVLTHQFHLEKEMAESQSQNTSAQQHHTKAAEHPDHASRHHKEAAKHHESGDHETAAHHALVAHGHSAHATEHATEASKKHAAKHEQKR